ncbi:dihydrofolate reductase family protein [Barrientosiimonas humi]|uniref:dihydrofolate reductase family protein n=1 Tax=Barrientosiimonas humi TaxID=999931 RepID=UPI00370D8440
MRELYPGTTQSDDNTESERELLLRLYDAPGPLLRLNFVSTLDGAATGEDNRSGTINTEADTRVFALLRAWADAIVVGAGTARAERYEVPDIDEEWQPLRTGRPARPLLVVVSAQDQLPPLLADAAEDEVLLISGDPVAPGDVVRTLRGLGHERILVEGGPHLAHDFVAAGAVDELCLTWSPRIVGGEHPRIFVGDPVQAQGRLLSLLEADDALISRWGL